MSSTLFLAFVAAAIPAFFTPGPNNLMLMASSAKFGLRATIPHMLGIVVGFPVLVFVVGLGLGELFQAYPWLKTVLKYAGAANLLWFAWTLLGFRIGAQKGGERPLRFLEAAAFQWINPKGWVMAVSFAALVLDPGPGRITPLILLSLGCLALGPFSSLLWMVFGEQLDQLLKRTGTERFLGVILASLMVVAVVLFLL